METRECCCIFYKKSEGMPRMMQTNSCKGTVYVVKEKDSLYKIAKAHGVRVKDIMRQNPFVNVYNLQIGDELCVPGFTNVIEGAFIPYVVKKGKNNFYYIPNSLMCYFMRLFFCINHYINRCINTIISSNS